MLPQPGRKGRGYRLPAAGYPPCRTYDPLTGVPSSVTNEFVATAAAPGPWVAFDSRGEDSPQLRSHRGELHKLAVIDRVVRRDVAQIYDRRAERR